MRLVVIYQEQVPGPNQVQLMYNKKSGMYFVERVLFGRFFFEEVAPAALDVVGVTKLVPGVGVGPVGPLTARSLAVRVVRIADTGQSAL